MWSGRRGGRVGCWGCGKGEFLGAEELKGGTSGAKAGVEGSEHRQEGREGVMGVVRVGKGLKEGGVVLPGGGLGGVGVERGVVISILDAGCWSEFFSENLIMNN